MPENNVPCAWHPVYFASELWRVDGRWTMTRPLVESDSSGLCPACAKRLCAGDALVSSNYISNYLPGSEVTGK